MALRRVLVLIQVFSLRSNRQAHAYQLNKSRQKAKVLVNVTHFRFLLFIQWLIYSMVCLTRVSEMSFSFAS